MISTNDAVAAVRAVSKDKRTAKVNEFMDGKARDKLQLQWRALFVSELRAAEVWPQGCK